MPIAPSYRSLLAATLLALVPGCFLAIKTAVQTTVNMERWDVSKITLGLRGDGICPRAPVQLAIFADASHVKRDKQKQLETWTGPANGGMRIGKVGFEEYTITATGGQLDAMSGWFTPDPDVLATAASGFTIEAVYKKQKIAPAKSEVPPTYACITAGGVSGPPGNYGDTGPSGNSGESGQYGGSDASGGSGGQGTGGGQGGNGGPGGAGGNITAYAAMVKTPYHDKLAIMVIEGDMNDVVLFDPSRGYTLFATGGAGGSGGSGGSGGDGGSGGSAGVGGAGGNGGIGGNGGTGGDGGPGGSIVLVVDAKHPELEKAITLDVSGGPGGSAGAPGSGGRGGSGGSSSAEGASSGTDGTAGASGASGSGGRQGAPGAVRLERSDLAQRFAALPSGVTLL